MACGLDMLRIAIGLICFVLAFIGIITFYIYKVDELKDRSKNGRYCKDVKTESGLVRGCTDAGTNYFAFLGVPYAAPPTGTLRFKPPVKPDPWNKVLEANNRSINCPQENYGYENCLTINVFSPFKTIGRPLPVFIDIFGGGYVWGCSKSKGVEPLTKHSIIVASMNYRIGPLGYLCLGTEKAPGNAGMKDQVAALKWVKQNIANFGGDPNQVTIGGGSAGGAAVELLVLSKQGKGLFQQAIVESGSATSPWAVDLNPIRTAYNFAEKLGIARNTNINELGDYYQRVPPKKLSTLTVKYYRNLTDGTVGFSPCVEKMTSVNDSDAFMTESPYDTLMKENYKKVPMMFFFSAQEGLNFRSEEFYRFKFAERMQVNFSDFLPADLIFDSVKTRDRVAQNIRDFYFDNKPIRDNAMGYLKYFGDIEVIHSILNSVEIHSHNQNPVYLMKFVYRGDLSFYDKFYEPMNESAHADVLKHAILRATVKSERDKKTVERVSTLIANFVKFGNPTPAKTNLIPIIWPEVSPGNVSCLYLGEEFKVINKPNWESKRFWDVLYSKYRRKPLRPGE